MMTPYINRTYTQAGKTSGKGPETVPFSRLSVGPFPEVLPLYPCIVFGA